MHDTQGLIDRTARAFAASYKVGGNEEWLSRFKGGARKRELTGMQLWFIKEYGFHIQRVMGGEDARWFTIQRPNYKSTLRWKIFIQAVHLIAEGKS